MKEKLATASNTEKLCFLTLGYEISVLNTLEF